MKNSYHVFFYEVYLTCDVLIITSKQWIFNTFYNEQIPNYIFFQYLGYDITYENGTDNKTIEFKSVFLSIQMPYTIKQGDPNEGL